MERFAEILGNVDQDPEMFISQYDKFNVIMYGNHSSITLFLDSKYLFIIIREQYIVLGEVYVHVFELEKLKGLQIAEILEIMEEHKNRKIMDKCPTLIQFLMGINIIASVMNDEIWERLYKLVLPVKCKSARNFLAFT
jgi:hypothetical protein